MDLKVNGIRLFVDTEGPQYEPSGHVLRRRPSILILHGGPGIDHSPYRALGQALSRDFPVIYLDQRGSGRSESGSPHSWTLATWAADVYSVCEALGLDQPIILRHSFGGYVAQAYASTFPGQDQESCSGFIGWTRCDCNPGRYRRPDVIASR
ncbi:MAG TPA: alpha/beta fold hydrolase [Oligoflexus sp.]|uniref:alpha/beta fold hydrolase n=1 Tax=Oligoflexus sp. TaxID=1971216 RepID=UPI002D327A43|nr:alpha/beta fold hydrolase [Oligoflexus sp.]HYX38653.1 alpha/beta fold hydrolase [Oligoflexus sp.]